MLFIPCRVLFEVIVEMTICCCLFPSICIGERRLGSQFDEICGQVQTSGYVQIRQNQNTGLNLILLRLFASIDVQRDARRRHF